jgi:hypothetical protein
MSEEEREQKSEEFLKRLKSLMECHNVEAIYTIQIKQVYYSSSTRSYQIKSTVAKIDGVK